MLPAMGPAAGNPAMANQGGVAAILAALGGGQGPPQGGSALPPGMMAPSMAPPPQAMPQPGLPGPPPQAGPPGQGMGPPMGMPGMAPPMAPPPDPLMMIATQGAMQALRAATAQPTAPTLVGPPMDMGNGTDPTKVTDMASQLAALARG